jgi:RNA polymerase sigma-70 factor, ECF subfamily
MAIGALARTAHCGPPCEQVSVTLVEATDALLMARLCAGDDDALAEVFDQFGAAVYGAAARIVGSSTTAQDVVQEVFVQLWSRPDRYDPDAGPLGPYLVMLARHRALDLTRSELRRAARQVRHHRLSPVEFEPTPDDRVAAIAAAAAVRNAVDQLPPAQRAVVELAYFQGLTFREVARTLDLPEGTAKSRLRLALTKLESVLDRHLLEST